MNAMFFAQIFIQLATKAFIRELLFVFLFLFTILITMTIIRELLFFWFPILISITFISVHTRAKCREQVVIRSCLPLSTPQSVAIDSLVQSLAYQPYSN